MYKVLITTWINVAGRGVAVHTTVVEFKSQQAAQDAQEIIEEGDDNTEFNQTAVCLF